MSLGQDLARTLGSNDVLYKKFGKRLFLEADNFQHQNKSVLKVFHEVVSLQSKGRLFLNFKDAAES